MSGRRLGVGGFLRIAFGRIVLVCIVLSGGPLGGSARRSGRRRDGRRQIPGAAGVGTGTRPGEIVGATGRRLYRIAAAEYARRDRIGFLLRRMIAGAQQLAALAAADRAKRNDRTDGRLRSLGRRRCLFFRSGQGDRHDTIGQHPAQVVLDIVGELLGAVFGEMHAIIGAQPAGLSLEVRALLGVVALLVNEAVPDIDIGDAGFLRAGAVKLIEVTHVARRLGAADRRHSHPKHRHALALERRDHVVDAL